MFIVTQLARGHRPGILLVTASAFCILFPTLTGAQDVSAEFVDDHPAMMISDRQFSVGDILPPKMHSRVTLDVDKGFDWKPGAMVISDSISHPGASWIQLHFEAQTDLGENSTITITSEEDGESQTFNSVTLRQWGNSSAQFNGDTVSIKVNAAPGEETSIKILVKEVTIGIPPPPLQLRPSLPEKTPPQEQTPSREQMPASEQEPLKEINSGLVAGSAICDMDNRVPSADRAVGRVVNAYCTGWITANGAHLTAGHCPDLGQIHFQVPLSNPDGTPGPSAVADQYPIIVTSILKSNDAVSTGRGEDWAVFDVYPNTETGLLPVHQQQAFYRLTDQVAVSQISITGYGSDNDLVSGGQHSNSWTQQLSPDGAFISQVVDTTSDVFLNYWIYSTGGTSGGPVVDVNKVLGMGIHTNGCFRDENAAGTGFFNQALAQAIQTFPGPNTVYVDNGHPETMEDGSIFRPYDTLAEALNDVPANGILSIVTGTYYHNTPISNTVTLTAPVGRVTIQ
jgi:hypothetical protein